MKLQSIQVLRGLAALLVTFYHALSLQLLTVSRAGVEMGGDPMLGGLFANGYAGVDLFFVISGFIMVWVTRQGRTGPAASGEFFFARITRIYPLWWAAALAATIYYLFLHVPDGDDPAWRHALQAGGAGDYLLRSFLLIPQANYPVHSIGWTLIHEMYFYVVFGALLLLPRVIMPFALLLWGAVVIAASFLGLTAPEAGSFLTLAVHPLTMEFLFGAIVGLMVVSGLVVRGGLITLIASLWLIGAICLQGEVDSHMLEWGRVVAFGLPSAMLVYGAVTLDLHGRRVWLLPAVAAVLAAALVFQFFHAAAQPPFGGLAGLVGVSLAAGLAGAGLVLLIGWAGGRYLPGALFSLAAPLEGLMKIGIRLGDWSYSIYLGHLFVIGGLHMLFPLLAQQPGLARYFDLSQPGYMDDAVYILAVIAGTVIVGWLGYTLVERPSLRAAAWLRRRWFPRGRLAREG